MWDMTMYYGNVFPKLTKNIRAKHSPKTIHRTIPYNQQPYNGRSKVGAGCRAV